MDSWNTSVAEPLVKFEASPAESFVSIPGEPFASLFAQPSATTMDPSDMLSPPQDDAHDLESLRAGLDDGTPAPDDDASEQPSTEKKTKKRKSWGQVLPEPKTNLPPRKRAKTEDEKEQRRVERVLRNRRAAQSSRERKRLEVEALEKRNKELEQQLLHFQKAATALAIELQKTRRNTGAAAHQSPLTFSQELFSSHDAFASASAALPDNKQSLVDVLIRSTQSPTTVNPASISPAVSPVPDRSSPAPEQLDSFDKPEDAETSPDSTQHPAEMLCSDLQCRSAEVPQPLAQSTSMPIFLALYLQLTLVLTASATTFSVCQRPLMQIAMSLKAGFSLPPAPALLKTIIWLVTQPSPSRRRQAATTPSTSPSSSTPPSTSSNNSSSQTLPVSPVAMPSTASPASSLSTPSTTLRLRLLRKILTCSPSLARPLSDATLEALRLVQSEERRGVDRVNRGVDGLGVAEPEVDLATVGSDGQEAGVVSWTTTTLPSKEVLLTLLWAIKVEERVISTRQTKGVSMRPGRLPSSVAKIDAPTASLKSPKRAWTEHSGSEDGPRGRRRLG